jgi:hypothetical protein
LDEKPQQFPSKTCWWPEPGCRDDNHRVVRNAQRDFLVDEMGVGEAKRSSPDSRCFGWPKPSERWEKGADRSRLGEAPLDLASQMLIQQASGDGECEMGCSHFIFETTCSAY